MTQRRDLKRRVRDRMDRTRESYTTALRRVKAKRPGSVSVVELVDLTELAAARGMKCRIMMFPELADRVVPERMLDRLRDVLQASEGDDATAQFRAVAFRGEGPDVPERRSLFPDQPAFLARAKAGIGGISASGFFLALAIEGKRGLEMLLFHLVVTPTLATSPARPPFIVVTAPDLMLILPRTDR
jgi:hypothetical protein